MLVEPLDEGAAAAVVDRISTGRRHEAVAVCLLNAYANPVHEQRLAEMIRARRPDIPVTCSSDVTREFREYERAATVSLAAYVQPVIDGDMKRFTSALNARGFTGRFSVMQSNGRQASSGRHVEERHHRALLGTGRRCHRRRETGRPIRLRRPDHLRHGRGQHGCLPRLEWRAGAQDGDQPPDASTASRGGPEERALNQGLIRPATARRLYTSARRP
jgi:hypothetical protein